jgi:hypothetical protein
MDQVLCKRINYVPLLVVCDKMEYRLKAGSGNAAHIKEQEKMIVPRRRKLIEGAARDQFSDSVKGIG